MKQTTFLILGKSICTKRLGGVLTKPQMKELQRRVYHEPILLTIQNYIGEIYPNIVFKVEDDGYLAGGNAVTITIGTPFWKRIVNWFGIVKKK